MKKHIDAFGTAVLLGAATFLIASCSVQKPAAAASAPEEEEVTYAVNAYRISAGNLDEYLEFGGDVASVSAVDIMPEAAGKVSSILVAVGDKVTKDQVIAYVDPSSPGMNYRASPVKAPISGRVTSFAPTVGSSVSQAMSIAKISQTDDLEIKTSVAERFISRIENGQHANVTFDAYPGLTFGAQVFEVSPVLDTATRTMAVKLRLTEPNDRIKVGMYARIRLVTSSVQDAIVVPSSCIISRDGNPYVFVVRGERAELRAVTEGITVDNKTEIVDGLAAGEEIVSKGQSLLNDGAKINVIATTGAN